MRSRCGFLLSDYKFSHSRTPNLWCWRESRLATMKINFGREMGKSMPVHCLRRTLLADWPGLTSPPWSQILVHLPGRFSLVHCSPWLCRGPAGEKAPLGKASFLLVWSWLPGDSLGGWAIPGSGNELYPSKDSHRHVRGARNEMFVFLCIYLINVITVVQWFIFIVDTYKT